MQGRQRRSGLTVVAIVLAAVMAAAALFPSGERTAAQSPTLTPDQIFAQIAPAIPIIETDAGTGSGVLIDSRHVLTAAHVV